MSISKKNANVVRNALQHWVSEGSISEQQRQLLLQQIQVQTFDWRRLARYAFLTALASLLIAITSLFADHDLMRKLDKLFHLGAPGRTITLSISAIAIYLWALRRRTRKPAKRYSNEALLFIAVLLTACAFLQLAIWWQENSAELIPIHLLLILSALVYGVIGWFTASSLVWWFSLLVLGVAFGVSTGYISGYGSYWLGMNYPVRFIAFASLLIASWQLLRTALVQRQLERVTLAMGLLYLFIALWLLSIFGNYGELSHWYQIRQFELLQWSLLFGVAAVMAIWLGLKHDDKMLRGFGLTFLAINLYTRFFEFFWLPLSKSLFFLLLGLSLWLLGHYAEKIWQLTAKKPYLDEE
ncbi:DUF2157 domain-containing protein [Serratia microhaemolytica]|uniref:DUF2157 domain-containing protein n=1 Tax=Serratia microhaemolytica TaxID=2675110 RepID=UPI000FDCEB82|nr:DUF2157 domain-containing protein [Serratia microhaemolytica]